MFFAESCVDKCDDDDDDGDDDDDDDGDDAFLGGSGSSCLFFGTCEGAAWRLVQLPTLPQVFLPELLDGSSQYSVYK